MQIELYQMIIQQLEILVQNFDLNTNLFIIKRNNILVGFELAENKDEPLTAKSNELVEYSTIIELYIDIRQKLGYKERSSMFRAIRLSKKLTQSDVASMLEKTKQEISRWENRYNPPQKIIDILIQKTNKKSSI